MSEPPYTPLPGKIKAYFAKIQEVGVPEKANRDWLRSVGFKSSNDRYLLRILKAMGFINDLKVPTELWRLFRDPTQSGAVLAQAIRTGYEGLFGTYEDAYRKDREAIYAYFSSQTDVAESTINLMVSTFMNLCQIANFEVVLEVAEAIPEAEVAERPSVVPSIERRIGVPEIHINIQLHLPETSDPSVYDNLFKSLKKHLLTVEE